MTIEDKLKKVKSGELKSLISVLKLIENLLFGYTAAAGEARGMVKALIKILED